MTSESRTIRWSIAFIIMFALSYYIVYFGHWDHRNATLISVWAGYYICYATLPAIQSWYSPKEYDDIRADLRWALANLAAQTPSNHDKALEIYSKHFEIKP